jgi:hypothetical protein
VTHWAVAHIRQDLRVGGCRDARARGQVPYCSLEWGIAEVTEVRVGQVMGLVLGRTCSESRANVIG